MQSSKHLPPNLSFDGKNRPVGASAAFSKMLSSIFCNTRVSRHFAFLFNVWVLDVVNLHVVTDSAAPPVRADVTLKCT